MYASTLAKCLDQLFQTTLQPLNEESLSLMQNTGMYHAIYFYYHQNKELAAKVILYKFRAEVALVKQPTIGCVFLAYLNFKAIFFDFLTITISNFLMRTIQYLKKLIETIFFLPLKNYIF